MKIGLFYFSGTGNTEIATKKWKEEIEKYNHEVSIYKIEDGNASSINFSSFDEIGFGYPVHAFNTPKIVIDFVRGIKKQEMKKICFIYMVSGENLRLNYSSSNRLKRILRRKNICTRSEYHYLMPYNIIFRHSEENAYKMYDMLDRIIKVDAYYHFNTNTFHKLKKNPLSVLILWMFRIEHWFSHVNGKHYKIDTNKCIKCMKCVDTCPTHNISYEGDKFIFGNKCSLCMRCSFGCPVDAFHIGLLDNWRVNKPYEFKPQEGEENDKHKKFLIKSYNRYYKECEEKIKKYDIIIKNETATDSCGIEK